MLPNALKSHMNRYRMCNAMRDTHFVATSFPSTMQPLFIFREKKEMKLCIEWNIRFFHAHTHTHTTCILFSLFSIVFQLKCSRLRAQTANISPAQKPIGIGCMRRTCAQPRTYCWMQFASSTCTYNVNSWASPWLKMFIVVSICWY